MRSPLDLNNLPDDFSRDHSKQSLDDSSSAASGIYRKKKSGSKDDTGKVYECRFCSLKFGKSQALGGHMNRHRQERETETLNQARQLVFSTDNVVPQTAHQLGGQPAMHGGYHYPAATGFNIGGTVYPTRLYSGTSTTLIPPAAAPPLQHAYTSHHLPSGFNMSQYPNNSGPSSLNDHCYVDHRYASTNPHQFGFQNLGCAAMPAHDTAAYN